MLEVIEEHKSTAFYAFRFGGGLTVTRDRHITVPDVIEKYETIYIQKYLAAVSEREKVSIDSVSELAQKFPKYMANLKVQKHLHLSIY